MDVVHETGRKQVWKEPFLSPFFCFLTASPRLTRVGRSDLPLIYTSCTFPFHKVACQRRK